MELSNQLLFIVSAGLFWIVAIGWLLHGMGKLRTAAAWLSAWMSIWIAGILVGADPSAAGSTLSSVFGTLFGALLLVGTYRFGDRPLPKILAPLAAVLTMAVATAGWLVPQSAGAVSSIVDVGLVGCAAGILIRDHTLDATLGPAERSIGPLFLVIVGLEALDWRHHGGGAPNETLGVWAAVGVTTGFLMINVVGERARAVADRQALKLESEAKILHGMSAAVPVGILLSDPDGRIELINERMCEHLGAEFGAADWEGRQAWELMEAVMGSLLPTERRLTSEYAPAFAADRTLAFAGQPFRFADGRTVMLSAHSVVGEDDRHLGRVWVSRDATEERRLTERIQHAERMETVGTLAGGLAHDFNNQLTAILGSTSLVRQSETLSEDSRVLLGELEEAAQHCADLTRGLLTFARREPADPHNIELSDVFDRVDTLLRPSLSPNIMFHRRIEAGAERVHADETQLQRVLTNLLVNARDAVAERGEIELSASPVQDGVEISVRDNGAGIDPATLRRVFDPFFTTKPSGDGTGLGLAIVYGIVEAHGARVDVDSEVGKGSVFCVSWPGPDLDSDHATTSAESAAVPPPGTRVLLAEDEPIVRRLITRSLERAGLHVTVVNDGDSAIAEFEKRPGDFDLVLFDYSMPGRNGLEAVQEVRQLRPGTPAAIMSGRPSTDRDQAWPNDLPLLLKPFSPERLLARLAELVSDVSA